MIGENFNSHSLRKATVAFGALFNNIILEKKDVDGNELKRIKVPLAYGSKEKYLARLLEDSENKRPAQLPLPRMAFNLVGLAYDPNRKQQTMIKNRSPISSNPSKLNIQYVPVPYDLFFELQIMTREISDGLEIIGMILPNFTPDYTVNVIYSSTIGEMANKDTPVILNNISFVDNTEGPSGEVRLVIWTLNFTMKAYIFGQEKTQSQIKSVQVNFYVNGEEPEQYITYGKKLYANTTRGSNTFVTSSNVANTINVSDIILVGDTTVKVTGISGNVLTGNVKFTTDAEQLIVQDNRPSTVIVSRYTANVNPNTALITDTYTISEMFEDFT